MQGWIVTAAPSAFEAAVRHREDEAYGLMSWPLPLGGVEVVVVVADLDVLVDGGLVVVVVFFVVVVVGFEPPPPERGGVPERHWEPEQPAPGSGDPSQVHADLRRRAAFSVQRVKKTGADKRHLRYETEEYR